MESLWEMELTPASGDLTFGARCEVNGRRSFAEVSAMPIRKHGCDFGSNGQCNFLGRFAADIETGGRVYEPNVCRIESAQLSQLCEDLAVAFARPEKSSSED
jgi:hypothetical protein